MKHGHQGEGGGKPPKYQDSQAFADKVLEYFDSCEKSRSMPNKAGLCVFLNISRSTYNEYKKKYPDALKGIEDYIENAWVQRLAGTTPTGAIFYLKNAFSNDYRDRTETDLTTKGEKVQGFQYIPPDASKDQAGA